MRKIPRVPRGTLDSTRLPRFHRPFRTGRFSCLLQAPGAWLISVVAPRRMRFEVRVKIAAAYPHLKTSKRFWRKAQGCTVCGATLGKGGAFATSKRLWPGFEQGNLPQPLRGRKLGFFPRVGSLEVEPTLGFVPQPLRGGKTNLLTVTSNRTPPRPKTGHSSFYVASCSRVNQGAHATAPSGAGVNGHGILPELFLCRKKLPRFVTITAYGPSPNPCNSTYYRYYRLFYTPPGGGPR